MTLTTRASIGAGVLQNKLSKTIIKNLEPELAYYNFGVKPVESLKGFGTVSWLAPTKLSITVASATITEGTNPTRTPFTIATVSATPTQYGMYVEVSDRLMNAAPVDVMNLASIEIGSNMGRIIDQVIQNEVLAGTKVFYANSRANRAAVTATDILTEADVKRASTYLRTAGAKTYNGDYVAIVHTYQASDLRSATGAWMEASKYTMPENFFNGETGKMHGVRFIESGNVQTFASTTTVYPALFMGQQAYGVAEISALESVMNPPKIYGGALNLVGSIGAKIDFCAKRLNELAMIRLETGAATYPV